MFFDFSDGTDSRVICRYTEYPSDSVFFSFDSKYSMEEVPYKTSEHISRLFLKSKPYRFFVIIPEGIEHYRRIPSVQKISIENPNISDLQLLKEYYPKLEMLYIHNGITGIEDLPRSSNLIIARNALIGDLERPFTDYLIHFGGRNASLCGVYQNSEVQDFIDGWRNKRYSENIKFVFLYQKKFSVVFNPEILNDYREDSVNPIMLPTGFRITERDNDYLHPPKTIPFENSVCIVRKSDGKVLSIDCNPDVMVFRIFDEDELLPRTID